MRAQAHCAYVAMFLVAACADAAAPAVSDDELQFVQVVAGSDHSCALTNDGRAFCWGPMLRLGYAAQPPAEFAPEPFEIDTDLRFQFLSAGVWSSCGVGTSGATYCWGQGVGGTFGNDSFPRAVPGAPDFTALAHAELKCGLDAAGAAYCWGDVAAPVPGGVLFTRFSVGAYHSCGLAADGAAYCWGLNTLGQLGIDSVNQPCHVGAACNTTPTLVAGGARFTDIAAGVTHTCGVTTAGGLLCWGENTYGQLGTGDRVERRVPTGVLDSSAYRAVVAGEYYTCALTVTSGARCWGKNQQGLLGVDTLADPACAVIDAQCNWRPAPVRGGYVFRSLAAGRQHACGIVDAGSVYCWGEGRLAQLGDSLRRDSPVPVRVSRQSSALQFLFH